MKRILCTIISIITVIAAFSGNIYALADEAEQETPTQAVGEAEQSEAAELQENDTPVIEKITSGRRWLKVHFKRVSDADYYVIYIARSKNSRFKKAGTTVEKRFKVRGLKNKKHKYYFKVRAVKKENGKKSYSGFSKIRGAYLYKYQKTIASAQMLSEKEFASKKLASVKKGTRIKIIKKYKRWYRVEYKGKTGYIYNKAFKKIVNLKKSRITKKNYKIYIDDWIFKNGRGIRAAYNYVSDTHRYTGVREFYKYKSAQAMEKHQDQMATHALTHRYTSCKGYASLLKSILERQGHETYFVFAHQNKYNGVHVWCVVKTKKGYRHIDSRRRFYLLKDSELPKNPRSRDLNQLEDSYPPCV